jgi:hypothetical protein
MKEYLEMIIDSNEKLEKYISVGSLKNIVEAMMRKYDADKHPVASIAIDVICQMIDDKIILPTRQ